MKKQGWRAGTIGGFGILAAWFLACAGEDTPPVDNALRGALVENFGGADGQMGLAGAAGGGLGGAAGAGGRGTPPPPRGGSGGSGSPVGGGGSGSGGGQVCDAFNTILADRCGSAGCHGPNSSQGDFGASEEAVLEYVDEPSLYSTCDGLFIDTANPRESLIYTKLFDDFPDGCGNLQMPANGAFLTDEQSACVLDWLTQF